MQKRFITFATILISASVAPAENLTLPGWKSALTGCGSGNFFFTDPTLLNVQAFNCGSSGCTTITATSSNNIITVSSNTTYILSTDAKLGGPGGGSMDLLVNDVGVAGIHRLMHHRERLAEARVVIVCAGMEGALPSVVGGLVMAPVIAVPTSVGYGASFQGLAALLGMLNSCASNVTVVNIDNGFGAGYAASLMNRL